MTIRLTDFQCLPIDFSHDYTRTYTATCTHWLLGWLAGTHIQTHTHTRTHRATATANGGLYSYIHTRRVCPYAAHTYICILYFINILMPFSTIVASVAMQFIYLTLCRSNLSAFVKRTHTHTHAHECTINIFVYLYIVIYMYVCICVYINIFSFPYFGFAFNNCSIFPMLHFSSIVFSLFSRMLKKTR